ncbi:hypothetical protein HQ346_24605 [Rhodococcus sp. BP-252]|uniref:hypothetical protein n=1 Tax=unclassified Rhodococcus (in: high G+C Gram-positive bacteria) TaxID=192944 RepID=UPI000DF4C56E|nr:MULTISPECIES: hypothetical protein [unclassified Rhodococcus (in: high G+C Gram-positive bacteria)]MBY6414785.1 hypothetical protein [Rhodococcus sp. BP-320]MBY6419689.1 hypothetical protein [Rhodococcus sp. BP-321]MBY6424666.1 hypothetical protein [Rhodococcus sp. BP-324]MBY6429663.1 hypothetical protein [Rhodococcus sp. BP-323]MBY6434615.1 hypothetical protein [Rhodococcus sp. BP-322]
MSQTAESLQALYDSAPNARLILEEGRLVLDVPEQHVDNDVVEVITRAGLLDRLAELGTEHPSAQDLENYAPVVDDIAAKLGA